MKTLPSLRAHARRKRALTITKNWTINYPSGLIDGDVVVVNSSMGGYQYIYGMDLASDGAYTVVGCCRDKDGVIHIDNHTQGQREEDE